MKKCKISARGKLASGEPNPVDAYVGSRIRRRRVILGWSQAQLGEIVGLTFQQVQRYESGEHRVSSSKLWSFALALRCRIPFFFEEMNETICNASPRLLEVDVQAKAFRTEASSREELGLARAYRMIKGPKVRQDILELTKSIGNATAAS